MDVVGNGAHWGGGVPLFGYIVWVSRREDMIYEEGG